MLRCNILLLDISIFRRRISIVAAQYCTTELKQLNEPKPLVHSEERLKCMSHPSKS